MADTKEKIPYLSFLRAAATVSVVFIHIAGTDVPNHMERSGWIALIIYSCVTRFAVPVFFMVSGALMLNSDRKLDIGRLYKKNIAKMLVILAVWGMFFHLYLIDFQISFQELYRIFVDMVRGNVFYHFWFLFAIIGIYMMLPIVKVFTEHASRRQIEYFLLLFFVFVIFRRVLENYNHFWGNNIGVHLDRYGIDMGGFLGYAVLGHYLHEYEIPKKIRCGIYACGIVSAIGCTVLSIVESRQVGTVLIQYMDTLTLFTFCQGTAFFLFIKSVYKRENSLVVRELADASLGIYILHVPLIYEFRMKRHISCYTITPALFVPLAAVCVLLVSYLLTKIIKRIPVLGKWLV